jgi:glycosyltransferase involved in cell wall biosynthesis
MVSAMKSLDIIIPVYNEEVKVVKNTLDALKGAFASMEEITIILVDDGSDEQYSLASLEKEEGIIFVQHEVNRGYGAALKSGILKGSAPWIGITDADGSYPVEQLALFVQYMDEYDMVIGIRSGPVREIPWVRRLPKAMLTSFASYLAGVRIKDVNSGLRIFSRDFCYHLWGLFPSRFSFTSTLTIGAILGGFLIREIPINYYKRMGKSSVRPFTDTIRFFATVLRIGLLFSPMKIFGPTAAFLFALGCGKGVVRDYLSEGHIGNLAVTLLVGALEVLMLGLLGELIVNSRSLKRRDPAVRDKAS